MSRGQRKEKNKRNEFRKKVMWCVDIAFVYLKWVSAMGCVSQTCQHLATRIDEHFGKDKTSHIYQNLTSFKDCVDKCSKDCFSVLDTTNTKHQLRIKGSLYKTKAISINHITFFQSSFSFVLFLFFVPNSFDFTV